MAKPSVKTKADERAELREKLERDVQAYLEAGGQIHEATYEDTKMYRDEVKRRSKAKSKPGDHPLRIRASGPAISGQVQDQTEAQRKAREQHAWRSPTFAIGLTI